MFQNVCNKILVTEPKHYYLVLGGFGSIQYNFPGGVYLTYEGLIVAMHDGTSRHGYMIQGIFHNGVAIRKKVHLFSRFFP